MAGIRSPSHSSDGLLLVYFHPRSTELILNNSIKVYLVIKKGKIFSRPSKYFSFLNVFPVSRTATCLTSNSHSSAIADHMTQTGHRITWDHFDILATGQSDILCKIKETLLIRDLKPALSENVGSEKLLLY